MFGVMESNFAPDDPETVDGAPCAVQVVGRPYHEEATLSAVQVIDDVLRA